MAEDGSTLTAILRASEHGALFAGELRTRSGLPAARFDAALERMPAGAVVVTTHPSPDRHLDADLRVIALDRDEAPDAAAVVWTEWLREFLSAHRCG